MRCVNDYCKNTHLIQNAFKQYSMIHRVINNTCMIVLCVGYYYYNDFGCGDDGK